MEGRYRLWKPHPQAKAALTGPLEVNLSFVFDRPKSHYMGKLLRPNAPIHHIIKPDKDNLDKALRRYVDP